MVGDHWIQTDHCARLKGLSTVQAEAAGLHRRTGRLACATHVASYTLTAAIALVLLAWRTGLDLAPVRLAAGLAVSAISHYWADRRSTLRHLCARLDQVFPTYGKARFFDLGAPRPGHDDNPSMGTGSNALDQSFHILFLFIAALVIA